MPIVIKELVIKAVIQEGAARPEQALTPTPLRSPDSDKLKKEIKKECIEAFKEMLDRMKER